MTPAMEPLTLGIPLLLPSGESLDGTGAEGVTFAGFPARLSRHLGTSCLEIDVPDRQTAVAVFGQLRSALRLGATRRRFANRGRRDSGCAGGPFPCGSRGTLAKKKRAATLWSNWLVHHLLASVRRFAGDRRHDASRAST